MTFIAFLVAAFVLAITPGPGIAHAVARTVAARARQMRCASGVTLVGRALVLAFDRREIGAAP